MSKETLSTNELSKAEKEKIQSWLTNGTYEVFPSSDIIHYFKSRSETLGTIAVTASPKRPIEANIDFALQLSDYGHDIKVHLPARSIKNQGQLEQIGNVLLYNGIKKILVVAGDIKDPAGEFSSSLDLLNGIKETGLKFETIEVAGYPEGHDFIEKAILDKELQEKQRFASENKVDMQVVTQMCFKSETLTKWIETQRQNGINMPVVLGIPGPANLFNIASFAAKIGFTESSAFLKKIKMTQELVKNTVGNYEPLEIIEELVQKPSISGIRFYTFNEIEKTQNWAKQTIENLEN